MRIKFYTRSDEFSHSVFSNLKSKLTVLGHDVVESDPELIIAIGGDGTMLRAMRENFDLVDHVIFAGVKTGSLGFYADFSVEKIDELVEEICKEDKKIEEHYILEYEVCTDTFCKKGYAINEITLINPIHTQVMDIHIDDTFFYTTRGTGMCISTASGSTAYNKSLGGAIVDTKLPIFQAIEIASIHNNAYKTLGSPIILGPNREITIQSNDLKHTIITYDTEHESLSAYKYIKCSLSDKRVKLLLRESIDFTDRVKKSFL